jgi:hypothetical protein
VVEFILIGIVIIVLLSLPFYEVVYKSLAINQQGVKIYSFYREECKRKGKKVARILIKGSSVVFAMVVISVVINERE